MEITSSQNPRIKKIVRLRDDKKQRQIEKLMLVEGWDEINLAMNAGHKPQTLLTSPELIKHQFDTNNVETLTLIRAVFEKISFRENPDGWLAVFPLPQTSLGDIKLSQDPLIIVAESIEKPGNLGAILRTADAAGVEALLVCDARVDIYNPNVVRASRGTLFTVPTIEISNEKALSFLRDHKIKLIAATPQAKTEFTDQDLRGSLAIVLGTEKEGLSDFWLREVDSKIKIPMIGKVNSLNVSIANALIVYEALRQRKNLFETDE
jgi:TrmH family RNA methyltransferase